MVTAPPLVPPSLPEAAERLASLLSGRAGAQVADPTSSDLVFEPEVMPRPLVRRPAPEFAWAVDGGQALVADARCVSLVVTRAARVCFSGGECVAQHEGDLRAAVLGTPDGDRSLVASLGMGVAADAAVDVNLLRDHAEWLAVSAAIDDAVAGSLVLVDGDLEPDWRIPRSEVAGLLERASARGVAVAAVIKHSALSRGGAPLLGQLEIDATRALGPRSMWWAPVARTRPNRNGPDLQVVAARLDPDARFSFRVDLPAWADAPEVLGSLSALCDDAAFPGYPYPLAVADRLAACPRWLRDDVWLDVEDHLDRAGVPPEVRERAFADRHSLMERS